MKFKAVFIFLFLFFFNLMALRVYSQDPPSWIEKKDKHFLILYTRQSDEDWARETLQRAEEYYRKIADQIGYARYQDFWTWEDRVKIYIYPNEEIFHAITGQPTWSKGSAGRRHEGTQLSRFILTYKQEDGFLDGLLPHEISHLILRDYLAKELSHIPIWFDEAVAQLQEQDKAAMVERIMQGIVRKKLQYPLSFLITRDIRQETDPRKVAIFYAQSVSVIDFLIKKYGASGFADMCQFMREGKSLEQSMIMAYRPAIDSWEELEKKWLAYLNN